VGSSRYRLLRSTNARIGPVAGSAMQPSLPPLPPGVKHRSRTGLKWPSSVCSSWAVATSNTATVPSMPPAASRRPSARGVAWGAAAVELCRRKGATRGWTVAEGPCQQSLAFELELVKTASLLQGWRCSGRPCLGPRPPPPPLRLPPTCPAAAVKGIAPGLHATLSKNFSRRCFSAACGIASAAACSLAPTSSRRTALPLPPATASSVLSDAGLKARLQVSLGGMSVN
jgi:hypothetical protein